MTDGVAYLSATAGTEQTVTALIVTFNRCEMLREAVRAVLAQSHPVKRLIIVDNASTDGTSAMLAQAGYLADSRVDYRQMTTNTGGAGGFAMGLAAARDDTDAGWFWVMDDDVAPRPDCLAKLLEHTGRSECLHPLVVYEDGTEHLWEHILDPATTHQAGLENRSFANGRDWCVVNSACFEGMLVSRRILEAVGLPRAELFVYGDDNLFGFQASFHTDVIYVRRAVLDKRIKPNKDHRPFRIYYDVRNRFLIQHLMRPYYRANGGHRALFLGFMALYTLNAVVRPLRWAKVRAAGEAWSDGLRGLSGRRRY